MPKQMIRTGADKLISLVQSKGTVTVKNAAKALKVKKEVIEEWAEYLKEEGIIDVEYRLTHTYLIKKVTKGKEKKGFLRRLFGF